MSLKEKIQTAVKQKSKLVPFNDQTKGYCQCVDCPMLEQCRKNEMVFCSSGASENNGNMVPKGCKCPTCEVFKRYNLSDGYFCMHGEAE